MSPQHPTDISIPNDLLPGDGRFCSGPSKVRPEQVDAIVAGGRTLLGTSHRKPPIKNLVGSVRDGLTELFGLPEGWEIVLGNGGTTVFWDVATFGLIERRSHHLVFGEFSSKFADAAAAAPHLDDPVVASVNPGDHPEPVAVDGVDVYAYTHNETSTGVAMQLLRPDGTDASSALVAVDATSAAGGIEWNPAEVDVYYFAPQKCFASDGGLWFAACSPAAVERIERIAASERWQPASLDLGIALSNSKQNQTYNTPAVATLIMLDTQIRWMLDNGGLSAMAARSRTSADHLYGWAQERSWAAPFVADPAKRSPVVGTVDVDDKYDTAAINTALRANGILDTDSYRKLGRNQLRVGMFPAVDATDVQALTACLDWLIDNHAGVIAA